MQLLTRAALFALLRHSAHAVAVLLTLLVPRAAFGGPPATSIPPLALERRSLPIAAVDGESNADSPGADQEFTLANLGIGSSAARSYINGPAPSITAISPNPAPGAVGWVTTTLTVTGANFVNKPKVVAAFAPFVGDTSIVDPSRVTFVSSTQLLVSVDIWREATEVSTGSWTIRVTNPDGQSSNAAPLTISTPVPVVSGGSTNPGAPVAGQQFAATLNGSNYVIGSARLVVTGPGCAPCVIPNSALTTQTPTNLVGPITLASAGSYTIAVQNGTNGPQSSARVLVTALSPVIAPHVTPKGATLNGLTLSATVVRNFQISNLGSTSAIYQLIPVCVSSSSCSLGRSSIALGAGATDSVPLTFIGPSQPSTSATVRVAATVTTEDGTVASDTGSVVATTGTIDALYGVTATPLTPSAVLPPNWISAPYQWTVTNRGTQRNTYWTGYNTGAMTITWQPDTIIVLEPGQSRTLMIGVKAPNDPTYFTQVALNVDIVGADSLPLPNIPTQIVAISPMTFMASSSIYKVSVMPKNQDYRLVMPYGGGFEGEFWITNTGPNIGSFNYVLACTGIVLNCRPSAGGNNAPLTGSVTLAYQQQLHLQFSADLPQGSQQQGGASGIAKLSVVGVGAASSASDTGSYSLQFAGGSGGGSVIAVSPKTTRTVPANLAQTQQFTVSNSSNVTGNVTYAVSCSGTAIVSCNAPDHASANITAQGSDVVTVGFTTAAANRTGTVKLIASSGTVADTGFVSITTGATNGPLTIAMNSLNPGTSISRGQCLTIAAGDDAAYECGDLRLVHALPTTTTLNKARTPTLIYTSAHAHPVTLIAVDVTVDGTSSQLNGACATQITARLRFANADTAERAFPWTGPCGQRTTRRVVVPVDAQAHSMATGVYPYVLQVTVAASGLSWTASDSSGVLAVVNRSGGHFGAGWWLDGVEQLFAVPGHNDQLFWVGGDGSTRLYTQVASSNLFMVNPTLDRPDSIVKMSDTDYRRRLRNGAYVQFGAFLLHSRTVNASGQATQFFWNTSTGQLDSIMLAVPNPSNSASRRVYAFAYTSGLLTSVTSPSRPNGGTRTTTLARIGNDLAITDPGSVPVHYVSDGLGRITVRTNRLTDGARYDYDQTASVMTRAALDLTRTSGTTDSIRTSFCPAEAASLSTCASTPVDTSKVRTFYDGPRPATDVADTSAFYLTRFGAPQRIINALGQATIIERTDRRWPLLATATVHTNGHRVEASYTDRGLIQETRDIHPLGSSDTATTRYQWDGVFDKISTITAPTGEVTRLGYFASGDRQWQEDGRGTVSRTWFTYNANRQLQAIQTPGNSATQLYRIDYDTVFGNLKRETTPKGFVTDHLSDALGRDTLVITPTDDAQTVAWKRRIHSTFDVRDRLHVVTDSSVVPGTSQPQRLMATTDYDAEDNATRITREVSPDPLGLSTIVIASDYDAAGRKVRQYDPNLGQTTRIWRFDAAGNVTSAIRGEAISPAVTMEYDALNRLSHRVVPRGVANTPMTTPVTSKTDDDQRFLYDPAGNLATITNYAARIGRTFYPNGTLATDTLRIANADLNESDATRYSQHIYVVRYTYDSSGRRKTMTPPPGFGLNQVSYGYDPSFGALNSVMDGTFGTFRYAYTAAGLLDTLTSADGTRDSHVYDVDGRETGRTESNSVSGMLHGESWSLDARGKRTTMFSGGAIMGTGTNELYAYDGLGGVIATQSRVFETTPRDPLGNIINRSRTTDSHQENELYLSHTTRLRQITQLFNDDLTADTTTQSFLPEGDLFRVIEEIKGPIQCGSSATSRQPCDVQTTDRRLVAWSHLFNSYDAAGRLVSATKETSNDQSGLWFAPSLRDANSLDVYPKFERGVTEEYRYDGLGRRVWVRAYRNAYCPGPRDRDSTSVCISSVERSVYDGDQVLLEIRQPGDDTISTAVLESDGPAASTPRRYFGTVGYLHGPGIDHPLGLVRNYNGAPFPIIAHYHGLYGLDGATRLDGTIVSPCTSSLACYDDQLGDQPDFAGRRMSYGFVITSPSEGPVSWWGTMANMKENATGVLDMRSRVYDPRTGRFTQEDPIGLAGGMNLYGFAGGDPVNFSDPLGLCPITLADPTPCGLTGAAVGGVAGAGIGVAIAAGCASVTVGLCAGGAPMIISATTGLGTVIGGAIGTAITLLNNDGDPVGASGGERAGKGFTPGDKEKIRGPEGTPCTYCGGPTTRQPGATQSHGEHVIPRADGGNGSRDNGVNACRTCNLDKGKRSPSEWKPRWYDPPKQP